jgi:Histone chaperone domain CHZ
MRIWKILTMMKRYLLTLLRILGLIMFTGRRTRWCARNNNNPQLIIDLEEIDESNIITGGRRTRGKKIDFAKEAQKAGPELEEDDEDDEEYVYAPPRIK